MSVSNGQLANAATFNGAFVSKSSDSTVSATLTQDKESVLKEIATPATPASGYGKIYFKNDGKLYQLNDAGIETQVGTGTGGGAGGVNFITNGAAEDNNTTGWAVYADAAGASPVDGTGGTANVTNTVTAVTPLAGTYSFLLAKDAVNRQGQGWSYNFTVAPAYRAKVLQISFDYLVNSGTFTAGTPSADSDVTVWIYDVTNSQLIQPSSYKLLSNSASIVDKFNATFQSSSTGSSYRIIFHVATTSASAYTLEVDNVSVSPSTYVYGTPVTDWQNFTPTGSWVANTTYTGRWRRVGDSAEIQYNLAITGTPTNTALTLNLPSGMTIDTAKQFTTGLPVLGFGSALDGATAYTLAPLYNTSTSFFVTASNTTGDAQTTLSNTVPFTWSSGDSLTAFVILPISGWSSSVQTSDQTDTRVVCANVNTSTTSIGTSDTLVVFTNVVNDTHGSYSTSTGRYTVPVSGFYKVTSYLTITSLTLTTGQAFGCNLYLDGVFVKPLSVTLGNGASNAYRTFGSAVVYANAGQLLDIRAFNSVASTALTSVTISNNNASFERLSGPSAIAASETVTAQAASSAGSTLSNGNTVVFGTENWDSHSAYDPATGIFTAPVSGTYEVSVFLRSTSFIPSAGNLYAVNICRNGTTANYQVGGITANAAVSQTVLIGGGSQIKLNAGDTVRITVTLSSGTMTLLNDATTNVLNIKRVGN